MSETDHSFFLSAELLLDYHITGSISTFFYLVALMGIISQLRLIRIRKAEYEAGQLRELPTAILSLNQFTVSFLAFYSFFIYGFNIQPFNHYLVWPRMAASLLVLWVIFEIMRDRRDTSSITFFVFCAVVMLAGILWMAAGMEVEQAGTVFTQAFIVMVTILLVQGYVHQIFVIRKQGRTGAVALRLHQFFLLKDLSSVTFGLVMGIGTGWPLVLMNGLSAVIKSATIWHFRWVKHSSVALARRQPNEIL